MWVLIVSHVSIVHIRQAVIENVNAVDERRSKLLETEFLIAICRLTGRKMEIQKTVSSDF